MQDDDLNAAELSVLSDAAFFIRKAQADEKVKALCKTKFGDEEEVECIPVGRNVRLVLAPGKLDMHTDNPQQEEAEETLAVDYDGESLEIGFNVSYLIEALSALEGEQVRLTFSDAASACLIEDTQEVESLFVISPMVL